ncbi:MAG: hypothetical protein L0Z62_30330 [Gemmataceae bacterium]|nr:hypothetical protein [Gemmataceae bacterium]
MRRLFERASQADYASLIAVLLVLFVVSRSPSKPALPDCKDCDCKDVWGYLIPGKDYNTTYMFYDKPDPYTKVESMQAIDRYGPDFNKFQVGTGCCDGCWAVDYDPEYIIYRYECFGKEACAPNTNTARERTGLYGADVNTEKKIPSAYCGP